MEKLKKILEAEIAQRKLAMKHNPLNKAEIAEELSCGFFRFASKNFKHMKILLITSIFLLSIISSFAQCDANAGLDQTVCGLAGTFYSASLGDINSTGTWSTNNVGAVFSDINDPNATVTILPFVGTHIIVEFYWTENNTIIPCIDVDTALITFVNIPNANAGYGGSTCDYYFQLGADTIGGNYSDAWWTSTTSGVVFADDHDPNTLVDIATLVPTIYGTTSHAEIGLIWNTWNIVSCIIRDTVWVDFYETPVAYAGLNDSICGLSYDLQAVESILNSDGNWTVVDKPSPSAMANFSPSNSPTANVSVSETGWYGFEWEETNMNNTMCSTKDTVWINFIDLPYADAGIDFEVCGHWAHLDATSMGNGTWLAAPVGWADSNITATINPVFQSSPDAWIYYPNLNSSITMVWQEWNSFCTVQDSVTVFFWEMSKISGNVLYNQTPLNYGDAIVELYNINSGSYNLVDISTIFGNIYNLQGENGDYILKAKVLNTAAYPDAMDTYYNSEYIWENAQVLTLTCGDSINIDIDLVQTSSFTPGNGLVSGTITYETSGAPVTDAVFFIEDTIINHPNLYTPADINGYYEFDDLPIASYNIKVDLPGIPQITTHNFSVTAIDTLFENYDYYVDTVLFRETGIGIYADETNIQNIENPINVSLVSVYPNPFSKEVNLEFELEQSSIVEIQVIDINGKLIQAKNASNLDSGNHIEHHSITEKGVYFIVISINNKTYIKKIISE